MLTDIEMIMKTLEEKEYKEDIEYSIDEHLQEMDGTL